MRRLLQCLVTPKAMLQGTEHFYPFFEEAIREMASRKGGLVLDIGTPVSFRKDLAPYREAFEGVRMLSLDDPTAWKDRTGWKPSIGGDIAHLPFKSGCADGVICKDVLEHVPDPFSAVREIHRVMKPGSPGFFTVPFLHPYHAVRGSGAFDYWRFTRDGAKKLFEAFPSVQVERAGGAVFVVEQFLGRAQTFLLPRLLSPLWNLVDRSVPTRETTHLWMIRIRR